MAQASPTQPPPAPASNEVDERSITSPRARRQIGIWAAGSLFMLFSASIARRAIVRRNNWTRPLYFQHNDQAPITPINGPLEALEALSVATINAVSFCIMATGGIFFAFDIGSIKELRERTRKRLGYEDAIRREEGETEEKVQGQKGLTQEQWIAGVLSEEDERRSGSVKQVLAEKDVKKESVSTLRALVDEDMRRRKSREG